MRRVYAARDRYAFPALLSLLLAALLSAPVEGLILFPHQLAPSGARLIDFAVRLALFVWTFIATQLCWSRWLSRPPALVSVVTEPTSESGPPGPRAEHRLPSA